MAIARVVDGDEVRSLCAESWSQRKIAEHLRISRSCVRHHCKDIAVKSPTQKRGYWRATMSAEEPLQPSVNLAYLTGVICGDGCIYKLPRTYQLSISCDTQYPDLIETYIALIHSVLGRPASKHATAKANCVQVRVASKSLPVILGIPTGAKQQDSPVPEWIFTDLDYVRPFIRGLIETDGNIYHEYRNGGWCSRCFSAPRMKPSCKPFCGALQCWVTSSAA
jgi:hypothetical protein